MVEAECIAAAVTSKPTGQEHQAGDEVGARCPPVTDTTMMVAEGKIPSRLISDMSSALPIVFTTRA